MKRISFLLLGLVTLLVSVSCLREMNPLSPESPILRGMFGKANYVFLH